jgi:hypothetical protein
VIGAVDFMNKPPTLCHTQGLLNMQAAIFIKGHSGELLHQVALHPIFQVDKRISMGVTCIVEITVNYG